MCWICLIVTGLVLCMGGCGDGEADNQPQEPCEERRIIVDDDVAIGELGRSQGSYFLGEVIRGINDPDGGLEITYALNAPRVNLLGVTTVAGNVRVETARECAREVLLVNGRDDVPVLLGAAGPGELGEETEAARFIIDTVMAHPGRVEIVASGPLTNIATVLLMKPDICRFWKACHYLGAILQDCPYVMIDFNSCFDIHAAQYVMQHAEKLLLYPDTVTMGEPFTYDDLVLLSQADGQVARYIVESIKNWILVQTLFFRIPGFFCFDMNGIAAVLEPELAERTEQAYVWFDPVLLIPFLNMNYGIWVTRLDPPRSFSNAVTVVHGLRSEVHERFVKYLQ